jgi:hypothetical protein
MIQARAQMPDGRIMLLFGLSQGNLDRLKQNKPIYIQTPGLLNLQPGEAIGAITILYGETEGDIAQMLTEGGLIDDSTVVHAIPKGSTTPT